MPFRLLQPDEEKKQFVFDQPRELLEKAPGFNIDHWPETNIHPEELHGYWNFMGQDVITEYHL